jgi:hypothetical protein
MEVDHSPIEAFAVFGNVLDGPERILDDYIPFFAIIIRAEWGSSS